MSTVVRIHDLTLTARGGFRILEGVHLTVDKGQWLFITGPSGCGKTRLTEFIAAAYVPPGVTASGERVGTDDAIMLRQNAHMLFHPLFKMNRIVADIAASWNIPKNIFFSELSGVLKALGIEDVGALLGSYKFQLSGGERQRLALALPLVIRPSLVVLDEALSNVDGAKRDVFIELYAEMVKSGESALVVTTHRAPEFELVPARLVIMDGGKIVEQGEKEKVQRAPAESITRELLQWYR